LAGAGERAGKQTAWALAVSPLLASFQFVALAQKDVPRNVRLSISHDWDRWLSTFYREAGAKDAPAPLLLHGFP
jgi:hypothetical protein